MLIANYKKTLLAKDYVKKNINDEISLEEADSFYHVSLLAQAVCVIGVLAISVLAIFENSFTIPVEVFVEVYVARVRRRLTLAVRS